MDTHESPRAVTIKPATSQSQPMAFQRPNMPGFTPRVDNGHSHNHNGQMPMPPQHQFHYSLPAQNKRPVARHACLACREKKVKCDGEVPTPAAGENSELRHQQCSNCKLLGIECVFVKSQRGGRRKKDTQQRAHQDDFSDTSSQINDTSSTAQSQHRQSQQQQQQTPQQPQLHQREPQYIQPRFSSTAAPGAGSRSFGSTSSATNPPSPLLMHPIRNTFDPPPSIISAATSPFFHGAHSPPPASSERESSNSNNSLQEKVQQLQREAANLQSQLMDRGGSVTSSSAASDYFPSGPPPRHRRHHPHGRRPPDFFERGPPGPPWERHHRGPPPHHHWPPPPPPWAQHGPPPPFDHSHHPMPMHPGSGAQLPPPPSGFSSLGDDPRRKRPHTAHESISVSSDFSLPKLSRTMSCIVIPDEELEMFDLPNWKTTTMLIDLYYRYIHPSRPFLPPKNRLIYQLQVRQDASLIHAMFSSSCRFASSMMIPNPNLRDPQHWYFLAEKYWDYMDSETALQALVLLMGALGPGGYVQQSIEGSERTYSIMTQSNLLQTQCIANWNEYTNIATKKQVLKREDTLRTIWGSWKLNVFLRLNRGMPYQKISKKLLPFPYDLPLPQSDTQYNLNLGVFDTTDNHCLQTLKYKQWSDLERDLNSAAMSSSGDRHVFTDSDLIIIAIKNMEDIMDTIASGFLTSASVLQYNTKMKIIERLANSSLYQISHIKKKTAVINTSKLFSLFMLSIAKLLSNSTQCSQILFVKPHETQSNKNPDDVLNSLYKSKIEDIRSECLNLTPSQIMHYINTFMAALDAVQLLELGLGKIPEAANSNTPLSVVSGPLNFIPASEVSSMKSNETWWTDSIPEQGKVMSAKVESYNEFPDVWLQYPIFSVVVIAQTLTVLASSVILTKQMVVREAQATPDSQPGMVIAEFVIDNMARTVPVVLERETFEMFKATFNAIDLHEKIELCGKYFKTHGRFWPYVESTSYQIEAMINYIDDVISRT